MKDVLGIDVGKVIFEGGNQFFGRRYLESKQIEGAFDAIAELVGGRFAREDVHLVSKCSMLTGRRTLDWLHEHRFYERTGVRCDRVHFVLERSDKRHVARALGITHFVDDSPEVMVHLQGVVSHRVLFNPRAFGLAQFANQLTDEVVVAGWWDALHYLCSH